MGRYCPECGQRALALPYTSKFLIRSLVYALDFDRGMAITFTHLFIKPDQVVRSILNGNTSKYTNPVRYLLAVGIGLYLFVMLMSADEFFSRIPVYEDSLDHIIGLTHRHYVLEAMSQDQHTKKIRDLIVPIASLSENMSVSHALDFFVKAKDHLALVSDEYGVVA